MHVPEPIPTDVRDESFAGIDYHIRGQLVPELQVELSGAPVMFEHHVLLWKEPAVDIEVKKLAKGVKRMVAGPRLLRHAGHRAGSNRVLARLAGPGDPDPPFAGPGAARARAPVRCGERRP